MILEIIPRAEASVVTLMKGVNKVIINPLIILLFTLAVVYFVYGLVRYLLSPDNEEIRKSSKSHMLWGIIGMFIMVSVIGIMSLIINTLGAQDKIQLKSNGDYNIQQVQ